MAAPGRELLAYERTQPAVARPEPTPAPPARGRGVWRVVAALAVAMVLLVVGVAIGVVARKGAVRDQRHRAAAAEQRASSLQDQVSRQQSTIAEQQRQLAREKAKVEQLQRTPPTQPTAPTSPVAANAATSFGDGLYQVGVAIQPGQYRTDGTGTCYWAKLSTGDTNKVIVNSYSGGAQSVTIDSPYFESEACGTWTKVGLSRGRGQLDGHPALSVWNRLFPSVSTF